MVSSENNNIISKIMSISLGYKEEQQKMVSPTAPEEDMIWPGAPYYNISTTNNIIRNTSSTIISTTNNTTSHNDNTSTILRLLV